MEQQLRTNAALSYFNVRERQIRGASIISYSILKFGLLALFEYKGGIYQSVFVYSESRGNGYMSEYVKTTTIPFITSIECGLSGWLTKRNVEHVVAPIEDAPDNKSVSWEIPYHYVEGSVLSNIADSMGHEFKYFKKHDEELLMSESLIFWFDDAIVCDGEIKKVPFHDNIPTNIVFMCRDSIQEPIYHCSRHRTNIILSISQNNIKINNEINGKSSYPIEYNGILGHDYVQPKLTGADFRCRIM